jgi:hypothetical protein
MKKVALKKIIDSREKTWQFSLPESWKELTFQQAWTISPCLFGDTITKAKYELMKFIIPPFLFNYLNEFDLSEIGSVLNFLGTVPNSTKNLLPSYKSLLGPTDILQETTVNEYASADNALRRFLKSSQAKDLDNLVAALYRPKASVFSKSRQAYSKKNAEKVAKKVATMPANFKFLVMMLFVACKHTFAEMFKDLFPKTEEKGKEATWSDMKFTLAEAQIFGSLEATGENLVLSAFAYLDKKIKEQKAL